MTREQLLAEKRFLACLRLLHRLREEGLLSGAEYAQARSLLLDEFIYHFKNGRTAAWQKA